MAISLWGTIVVVIGIPIIVIKYVAYAKATEELISLLWHVFDWLFSHLLVAIFEVYIDLRVRGYRVLELQDRLHGLEVRQQAQRRRNS